MANQVYTLQVDVSSAQLDALVQQLMKTQQQAGTTASALGSIGANTTNTSNLTTKIAQLTAALAPATSATNTLNASIASLSAAVQSMANQLAQTNSALSQFTGSQNNAARASRGAASAHAGASREILVLIHEMSQGNFSKFGGSLMVLGEQFDVLGKLCTPAGMAVAGFTALIAISAIAYVHAAESLIQYARQIDNVRLMTGMSTDEIQKLNFALATVGIAPKEAGAAIKSFSEEMGKAKEGSVTAVDAFKSVGVSMGDLKNLSTEQILDKIAVAFQGSADDANKFRVATELFGPSATDMIRLLDQGSGSLKKLGDEASATGGVLSKELLTYITQMNERLETAHARSTAFSTAAKSELLPSLVALSEAFVDLESKGTLVSGFFETVGFVIKSTVTLVMGAVVAFQQLSSGIDTLMQVVGKAGDATLRGGKWEDVTKAAKDGYEKMKKEGSDYQVFLGKLWANMPQPPVPGSASADAETAKPSLTVYSHKKGKTANTDAPTRSAMQDEKDAIKDLMEAEKQKETDLKTILDQGMISQTTYFTTLHDMRESNLNDIKAHTEAEAAEAQNLKSESARKAYAQKVKDINAQIAQNDSQYQLNLALVHKKESDDWNNVAAAIDKYNRSAELATTKQINKMSMSKGQAQFSDQLDASDNKFADEAEKYTQNFKKSSGLSDDQLNGTAMGPQRPGDQDQINKHKDGLTALEAEHQKMTNTVVADNARIKAANADWTNGATQSFQQYIEDAQNVAGQTATLFTTAFKGMEDAMVNFVMTGKLSFTSLATSIISDLARMIVKALEAKALGVLMDVGMSLVSSGSGSVSSWASGASSVSPAAQMGANLSSDSIGSLNTSQGWTNANGGIYTGATKMYANGGIVSSPTNVNMGGSNATVAEAGKSEAIVPLPDGRSIPVQWQGASPSSGGGGNNGVIIQQLNVTVKSNGDDAQAQSQAIMQGVQQQLQPYVDSRIANATRPGNILNPVKG
jgi:lambda family phage tail tape measure protein